MQHSRTKAHFSISQTRKENIDDFDAQQMGDHFLNLLETGILILKTDLYFYVWWFNLK